MAERGDLTVLHEPFSNLADYGETDAGGQTFDSPAPLLAWLRSQAHGTGVFVKAHDGSPARCGPRCPEVPS
jgi:hypothetical protein